MPQDTSGPSVSATPYIATDEYQNLIRTPPVAFHEGHGVSQVFRGTVATNSTAILYTSPVSLNSYTMNMLRGGSSTLNITGSRDRTGTGLQLSHNERVAKPKAGQSRAMRGISNVQRLNRIRGIIQAPLDQVLQMEVAFGTYIGDNLWTGNYTNGSNIQIESEGVASVAMIKLTCNNPLNPGWFNFQARIQIKAAEQPAAPTPAAPANTEPSVLDEISDVFWDGIRDMQNGRFAF